MVHVFHFLHTVCFVFVGYCLVIHINGIFSCSTLSETTFRISVQKFYNHPKLTITGKLRNLLSAKTKSNGGRYFRNSTVRSLEWTN